MSDEKVIKVTASVPLIAELKVKELNTEINTPTLVADLNEVDTLGIVVQKESSFRVELDGYGEEVIPEPTLFKFNQHLIQALDQFSAETRKAFSENLSLTDYFSKLFSKLFEETATFSDVNSKLVGKGLFETSILSEQISKLIQSALLDTSTATEQIVFDIKTILLDTILTTDDVLGEANIDDDQYAFFEKVVRDVVPVSDLFITEISRLRYFDDFNVVNDIVSNVVESVKFDTSVMSDLLSYFLGIVKTDSLITTDSIAISSEKPLTDNISNSDINSFLIAPVYVETVPASDVASLLVSPEYIETFTNSDTVTLSPTKGVEDTPITSDTVSRIAEFNRILTEGPYATADYVLNLEGYYNYTRGLFAQDKFAFNVSSVLTDIIVTTDDVFGEANIDDDQYAFFEKVVKDDFSTSDSISFAIAFYRDFVDSVQNTEYLFYTLVKGLVDSINNTDVNSFLIAPAYVESVPASDVASLLVAPEYRETSTFTDVDYKLIGKGIVDPSTLSEEISKVAQKTLLDTSLAAEQIVFHIKPVFEDIILTTDDVLGEANIDDDQYAFFEKVVRDIIPVTDLFTTTISWIRYFDDSNVITDIVSNLIESTKLDVAQVSEVVSNVTQKVIIDNSYFTEHFVLPDYVASLYASDQLSSGVDKVFTELNITVEDFVRVVIYNRVFESLTSIPDQISLHLSKAVIDNSVVSDLLSYSLGIVKEDSAIASDQVAFSAERPLSDSINNSDINSFLIAPAYIESVPASDVANFIVAPEYRETTTNSDVAYLSPTKGIEDTSTNSDQLAFNVSSVLQDTIVTTDDVLGEANIDDDQYAFFDKVVKDDTTTSDSVLFEITFYKPFLDLVENTDLLFYTLAKGFVDSINLDDVLSFEGFKLLADNGSISDEISRQVSVVFIEEKDYVQPDFVAGATNLADQIAFSASKALSSTTSIGNEVISFVPIKGIEDLATVSEQITYNFTYNLSDVVQTTDDFYGNANIDDDQTAQVGKGLLDTSTLSDLFSSATSYNRSVDESVATNDVNSFLNAKSIVETVTSIENIAVSASKSLSEIAIASDTYLQTFTKALSETTTFSEYRWANKQDYLSSTYVQTGFVGSNYTI